MFFPDGDRWVAGPFVIDFARVAVNRGGNVLAAAALALAALRAAPPGRVGWMIPVGPFLRLERHPDAWAPVLECVKARAT